VTVREIIARRVQGGADLQHLPGNTPLGAEGLGLDSIAIAEVIVDCERAFQLRLADLLDGEPITIARIEARVECASPA
jgi:acyl carrier protein